MQKHNLNQHLSFPLDTQSYQVYSMIHDYVNALREFCFMMGLKKFYISLRCAKMMKDRMKIEDVCLHPLLFIVAVIQS